MSFQQAVHVQPAPAIEGDFCTTNPRYTVVAGPGALVSGPDGCMVARFGWLDAPPDPNGSPSLVNNYGSGTPDGFVGRNQQGLITIYLQESGMWIPQGFPVTLFRSGDFWVCNNGTAANALNDKAFANSADGTVTFGAGDAETAWFAGSVGEPGELVKIYNKFPV
jgi:hypothetical protein